MGNHFPTTPADASVSAIIYNSRINWDGDSSVSPSPMYSIGVATNIAGSQFFIRGYQVVFDAPGSYADFDQDVFEAALFESITDSCAILARELGISVNVVKSYVRVMRTWQFGSVTDPSWTGNISESVSYP